MSSFVSPAFATARIPTIADIRAAFPALTAPTVFLDNAGGSQVPSVVIERIRDYFLNSYVQLGADYEVSREATATVARAHEFVKCLMNAGGTAVPGGPRAPGHRPGEGLGECVIGPSTTALCNLLANAYAQSPKAGRDEIIVSTAGHESNVGPWMRLASRGFTVKPWPATRAADGTWEISIEALRPLLSSRTSIVAFPHVSNILGEIVDVKAITNLVHQHGGRVVADGVAFAPHRAIDVADWGVDWYVFSTYKVFGPHMAALFGRREAFAEITGPNHYFIDKANLAYSFELGGVSHEGAAGLVALYDYLSFLAGNHAGSKPPIVPSNSSGPAAPPAFDRRVIERSFDVMTDLELPLQARLMEYLRGRADVTVIGPTHAAASRVPTVSFVHARKKSSEIAKAANARGLGFRYGSFYSVRLCETMGLNPADGVVRVSLVHYNTIEEVERLILALDGLLGG